MDNCWDKHRVHLILDYTEDFTLERLRLNVRAPRYTRAAHKHAFSCRAVLCVCVEPAHPSPNMHNAIHTCINLT